MRATGASYGELIEEELGDLELRSTAVGPAPSLGTAIAYDRDTLRESPQTYSTRLVGSGGLVSSARDLARFVSFART